MLCFCYSNIHLMGFLSGLTVHFSMSDSNCLSVGADTKPRRMWPHGEANLHFHISHPHSDGDTHCSRYKMVVIVKMNMMIVRVMGALVVAMSVMMIACYCCQWRRWVFHSLQTHSRYLGCIRMTVGVQASSSRTGEITLGGMNVSGLQACHWHTHASNCSWITSWRGAKKDSNIESNLLKDVWRSVCF